MKAEGKQTSGGAGRGRRRPRVGEARAPEDWTLSGYLVKDGLLEAPVSTKEELLLELSRLIAAEGGRELADRIHGAVLEREASVNTYVGEGVAIPHARLVGFEGIRIAFARSPVGFAYGLETDEPVRIVVMVVGREDIRDEHVRVLGAIARLLEDPERREAIVAVRDAEGLRSLLASAAEARRAERAKRARRPRPLSQVLVGYATKIGRDLGVTAIVVSTESSDELSMIKRTSGTESFIVATSSRGLFEEAQAQGRGAVLLPKVPLRRDARVRLASLMALTHGLIRRGDIVALLSGDAAGAIDSMTVLEIGREFGRFVTASGEMSKDVRPEVLERALSLATELALEGREGKPVGTIFVIGDPERLAPHCQQMVMNPFRGYPEEERNILDPTLAETLKEFAAIDGAFVIRGDGVVVSAGTYLTVSREVSIPPGYGSRHRVACGITETAGAISVAISQSTGEVTVFKSGSVVLHIPRGS
jgi:DNA integrity scanning protein DisA with diadenylate cyclase activity/mannitol/fructose-specific phosphotransferase system IIA component (Ntr-type)